MMIGHWMLIMVLEVTCAANLVSGQAATAQDYTFNAVEAIKSLNGEWYDVSLGLWENAWWNSANTLTTLADFASLRLSEANKLNIGGYIQNTFVQAKKTNVRRNMALPKNSAVSPLNAGVSYMSKEGSFEKRGFSHFLNEFYDDEGWWALGLIRSYDVSGDGQYLAESIAVFKDMSTGTGTSCNGGIYWNKDRRYVNAIANELYLSVAASLARRAPQNHEYRLLAVSQWKWFENSGMINSQGLINDGLDSKCKNNGLQTWSYNQGVILGGLVELFLLTHDTMYLAKATRIAMAAIKSLSDGKGILMETDRCETKSGRCRPTSQQFKGVFVRNLRYLYDVAPLPEFRDFILRNADSIWSFDRNDKNQLGVAWAGGYTGATASTQSSALDVLVAAIAVA